MGIAQRIHDTVEDWQDEWKDRLRGWMISWLVQGVDSYFKAREPEIIDITQETLQKLRDTEGISDELINIIDKSLKEGDIFSVIVGWMMTAVGSIFQLLSLGAPLGREWEYAQDFNVRSRRLDPMTVITAWRRDPDTYEKYFKDLKEQGWSDGRIEALKFATLFYPSPQDLVTWEAKEVFEPAMIAKYGLEDEFETLDLSLFAKIGVSKEQARNYWIAHWEHASWLQIVEMLRRGLIQEQDVWDWFRLVEIPPYWRDKLIGISWNIPTRVDVRRFWDMRTINEDRLREIYTAQGYHDKDLDDYVLWTKVYVAFPDLIARFTNGWITQDEVEAELVSLGMPADRAKEMVQTKVKAAKPARTQTEKDLTRTDILKGVKTGYITREQGAELLMDLKYDDKEAAFILDTNVPVDSTDEAVKERELTKSDVKQGLVQGVITEDDAKTLLMALRYSSADSEFLVKIFKATIKPPMEPKLKEQSKADVITAVKKGLLDPTDAYLMLQDLDYSPEASEFILAVRAETSPFSPINYAEFKERTIQYKIAIGETAKPMTKEIKDKASELIAATDQVKTIQKSLDDAMKELDPTSGIEPTDVPKVRELTVQLHRAEDERNRVQEEYDKLLADWRAKEG